MDIKEFTRLLYHVADAISEGVEAQEIQAEQRRYVARLEQENAELRREIKRLEKNAEHARPGR